MRVAAAGVNPVDWKVRLRGGLLGEPPFTVGWDVAGTVEALGGGVTRFAVGDRVFGMPRFPREAAAYAEYVTSPSRQLARTPEGLSDVEAAALPLAGLTAWQALVETADVQPGQRVLVLGAAGGVGHLAVQIAKARGAHVIGTARSAKHAFLAEPGCRRGHRLQRAPGRGGGRRDRRRARSRRRRCDRRHPCERCGTAASSSSFRRQRASSSLEELADGRVRVTGILVEPDRAGLEAIAGLVESGALRPHVSQTFPLEDAARAHEAGETGRTQGKLVLTIP